MNVQECEKKVYFIKNVPYFVNLDSFGFINDRFKLFLNERYGMSSRYEKPFFFMRHSSRNRVGLYEDDNLCEGSLAFTAEDQLNKEFTIVSGILASFTKEGVEIHLKENSTKFEFVL